MRIRRGTGDLRKRADARQLDCLNGEDGKQRVAGGQKKTQGEDTCTIYVSFYVFDEGIPPRKGFFSFTFTFKLNKF